MQRPRRTLAAAITVLSTIVAVSVHAADHAGARVPMPPAFKQECGSCHVPYPPAMLPAASWHRLMNGLPQHFGTDASLDASTARQITAWLAANAGTGRRMNEAPPQDRITRSAWFVREHDEVPAGAWRRPSIKSPANCTACHAQADQGDFNEHRVRIPR